MSLREALDEHYRQRQAAADADADKRAALTAADRELVDDPFRPGEQCQRWEAEHDPRLRFQAAFSRSTNTTTKPTEGDQ